jgi:hypothetical protein
MRCRLTIPYPQSKIFVKGGVFFMKKFLKKNLAFLLAVVLILGMSPATANAATTVSIRVSGERNYSYAYRVLKLVNEERASAGLSALTMDTKLLSTAMKRAAETCIYWDHTRPDGTSCSTAFPDGLTACGENIAVGQSSPKDVMTQWMNSAGHRANILTSYYNVVGIGCYKVGDYYYWVQCFGTTDSPNNADSSDYTDGRKTYTVDVDSANLSLSVSLTKKTISQKSTGKVKVLLTNPTFPYNPVTLPTSQFTFTSSSKKVASVDAKGNITARKKGNTKIKVKFADSGKTVGKTVTVTVR